MFVAPIEWWKGVTRVRKAGQLPKDKSGLKRREFMLASTAAGMGVFFSNQSAARASVNADGRKSFAIVGVGSRYRMYLDSIQTEYSGNNSFGFENIKSLVIMTDYINSWTMFCKNSLFRNKLVLSEDYSLDEIEGGIRINFNDPSNIDLFVNVVNIDAQIGPGWIEQ